MEKNFDIVCADISETIRKSDFVLIGLGEELQYDWNTMSENKRYNEIAERQENEHIIQFCQKYLIEKTHDGAIDKAYDNLLSLLNGKNYFIVSTLIDDIIYSHGFDNERIVTPCGGYKKLQCSFNADHDIKDIPAGYMKHVADYFEGIRDDIPEKLNCPECGHSLIMNQIGIENYAEKGYLARWKNYMEWLMGTVNHSICIIELGEGIRFPSVIREPFEKMVIFNLKSKFYRINEKLYQVSDGISERSSTVACSALKFMSTYKLPEE